MKTYENFLNTLKEKEMIKDFEWIDESGSKVNIHIDSVYLTKVGDLIFDYVNATYGKFGVIYGQKNTIFKIGDKTYNSEYITKFVNNIKMYTETMRRENIKDGEAFVDYIKNHLMDMFHYFGKHFSNNYRIVTNTSNKGHRGENASLKYFSELIYTDFNKDIQIALPASIRADIDGVDGTFLWDGVPFTIQVKPFTSYVVEDDKIEVFTNGALKLNAHYLILYKEKLSNKYDIIVLKNGKNKDKISYSNSSFHTEMINVYKIETDVLIKL